MTNPELLHVIEKAAEERVTELDLSSMALTALPPMIGQLSHLTKLSLYNNQLSRLPAEIGQLTNLKELVLGDIFFGGNLLTALPPEIGLLTNLTRLILNDNQLSCLPVQIGQLTHLTKLYLRGNQLTTLPAEIGQLTHLKELDLSDNQLTQLPAELGQLKQLTKLYLSNNQLSRLPSEIGQLKQLTKLYLSNNQLSHLPSDIEHLVDLTGVILSNNRLSQLPAEIGSLTKLKELDIDGNQLSQLPSEIQLLSRLEKLDLRQNPIPVPPEILGSSWEALGNPADILTYYFQLQQERKKPLNEAKMLLVGQGSVGKTSLMKQLIGRDFDSNEQKTEGINIQPWEVEINRQKVRLNVWDFGGQEIMHATHQFFLTKRSLYLLVLDARADEEANRVEYWLKMIQSFGGDSPVIIVGNKVDQHPLELDRRGLQTKYKNIQAFVETSCQTGEGLDVLTAAILEEIGTLEHVHDLLPHSWFKLKQQLEHLQRDYIPYAEYERMCQVEGITDERSRRTLISFLHDLGIVLNFQEDDRLHDTNVLNPEWVTNGIYKILNDHKLIIECRGILERDMLNQILDSHRYPKHKHLFIVEMMRMFELCFDLDGYRDERFLIPDLLPKEEPYTGDWTDALAFEYHYMVLPNSVISRFIVRMNHKIYQRTYWRSGVVLKERDNIALVKADREEKKILILVRGSRPTRRDVLAQIRSQFDYIHETTFRHEGQGQEKPVTEHIPFPHHPEIVLDYGDLLTAEAMGETSYLIPKLKKRVDLRQLLNGIELEGTRRGPLSEAEREQVERYERFHTYSQLLSVADIPEPDESEQEVFISYAWGGESEQITQKLVQIFQAKGITVVRDKENLGYRGRIREFMDQLGRGKCVIAVISDKYLKSRNCMYELMQIAQTGEFHDRIFPILLPDAKIFDPIDRVDYVLYWETEIQKLNDKIRLLAAAHLPGLHQAINQYTEIRATIDNLTNILQNINALTAEIHLESGFDDLISAIEQKLNE